MATSKNAHSEVISEADLRLGLLAYPVLQAADIMLYKYVPYLLLLLSPPIDDVTDQQQSQ
jgi:tryptophanyl-tRNA synthetase